MDDGIKIISARRSYEFAPDDLRLSLICTQPVQQVIQQAFSFAVAQIGAPMATFEEIPPTIPPGVVFNYGFVALHEGEITPIRFLHFEPQRIVIDVAGRSQAIDMIYDMLMSLLEEVKSPDGSPAIGQLQGKLDFSEITFHEDALPELLLDPRLTEALKQVLQSRDANPRDILVPGLRISAQPANAEYLPSALMGGHPTFVLDIRANTRPEEGKYFSGASLDTDAHLAYINRLGSALASKQSGQTRITTV